MERERRIEEKERESQRKEEGEGKERRRKGKVKGKGKVKVKVNCPKHAQVPEGRVADLGALPFTMFDNKSLECRAAYGDAVCIHDYIPISCF